MLTYTELTYTDTHTRMHMPRRTHAYTVQLKCFGTNIFMHSLNSSQVCISLATESQLVTYRSIHFLTLQNHVLLLFILCLVFRCRDSVPSLWASLLPVNSQSVHISMCWWVEHRWTPQGTVQTHVQVCAYVSVCVSVWVCFVLKWVCVQIECAFRLSRMWYRHSNTVGQGKREKGERERQREWGRERGSTTILIKFR